jgi:hypothetical protein
MARATKPPKPKRPTRLEYLWQKLDRFEALSLDAEKAQSYTACVAAEREAVKLRAEIDEIEQVRAARKRRRKTPTVEAYYDELLDVVREIRIAAVASGSCIAANQAVKHEAELLTAKGVALDAAARASRAAQSTEDLEAEIARLRAARGA